MSWQIILLISLVTVSCNTKDESKLSSLEKDLENKALEMVQSFSSEETTISMEAKVEHSFGKKATLKLYGSELGDLPFNIKFENLDNYLLDGSAIYDQSSNSYRVAVIMLQKGKNIEDRVTLWEWRNGKLKIGVEN